MPTVVPRYLFAVASSSQMYSGIGTAIFDWIRHSRDDFEFSFLIDNSVAVNVAVTAAFCAEHKIPLHISSPLFLPGCPDTGLRSIALHLQQHDYDFVECVSWASASTNLSVLSAKPPKPKLLFTPHTQPLNTIPDHERHFMVTPVFSRMLHSADGIFIDSPSEKNHPEFGGVSTAKIHFIPLGVDTGHFMPSGRRNPYQLACVCDCREPRKRLDLLLAAFSAAHRLEPRLRLVLAGMGSDTLRVPDIVSDAVTRLGYITRTELLRLYQTMSAFVLISDYEAFGLPIAEALCCGTAVLLNEQIALRELFGGLPGVNWTRNADVTATAAKMVALGSGNGDSETIAEVARTKFAFENTYSKKREIVLLLSGQGASAG
jgi:glycosyltransferase involved in cell wall biosynthesis